MCLASKIILLADGGTLTYVRKRTHWFELNGRLFRRRMSCEQCIIENVVRREEGMRGRVFINVRETSLLRLDD